MYPNTAIMWQPAIMIFAIGMIPLVLAFLARGAKKRLTCKKCDTTHETEALLPNKYCPECAHVMEVKTIQPISSARVIGIVAFLLIMGMDAYLASGISNEVNQIMSHLPPNLKK